MDVTRRSIGAWATLAGLVLAACGGAQSHTSDVRYSTGGSAPNSCRFLRQVRQTGDAADAPRTMADLISALREHTAAVGGNFVVFDTAEQKTRTDGTDYFEGTGGAYVCDP